ncbi:MAG: triose-phosphate isomerase [Actinomycetota bacterium]
MRRPLVAGNWKMHKTAAEAAVWCDAFAPLVDGAAAEIAVCPPFTALDAVAAGLGATQAWVAAQNVSEHEAGAHTGEVSAAMIAAAGARGAIVGHSERRAMGETDTVVAARTRRLLDHGLTPIVCVGESLAQREAGQTEAWLTVQVRASLAEVAPEESALVVVAYEPIWAIGTGRTATPEIAQAAIAHVRAVLAERLHADAMRILYGGSVTPDNAADLMAQQDVDGALVGGASLQPEGFAAIVRASA